jgi:hypothetical protein
MSEALLAALNPGRKFEASGETIVVANVAAGTLPDKVARVEVDKSAQTLKAFNRDGTLLAFYPATTGSVEKPAPDGRLKVTVVTRNPTYRYNPDYAFKGVRSRQPFTIKPGPNNPGGVVWIGLPWRRVRHPRHVGAVQDQQDGVARLHPADQLGRAGACLKCRQGRSGGFHRQRAGRKECPGAGKGEQKETPIGGSQTQRSAIAPLGPA